MQLTAEEQHTDTSENDEYDQIHTDEEEDRNKEHNRLSDTEQNEETEDQPLIPLNIIPISEFN